MRAGENCMIDTSALARSCYRRYTGSVRMIDNYVMAANGKFFVISSNDS